MLRPLGVGERLDASFKIFGRNFLPMAKAVLVIAVPAGIVETLVSISTALPKTATTSPFGGGPIGQVGGSSLPVSGGDLSAYIGGLFVLLLIEEVVAAIATATCYRIIANSYLGQPADWRKALRYGASRFFSILWVFVLASLCLLLPAAGVAILALVFAALHSGVVAVLVGVFGGIAWILFAIWFSVCTRLAVPTLMIEDVRGWKAIRRSILLCRGMWWSVFGTELLAGLIVGVLSIVIGVVFAIALVATQGDATAEAIVNFFSRLLSLAVATPFTAAVLVILSIDLRVRKEGYDIEFLASQMGSAPTGAALSFIRPSQLYGYPSPYGYPPPAPGYPPPAPGYPPPAPGYPPPAPGYPPPAPAPGYPSPYGYPPPAPPGYAPPYPPRPTTPPSAPDAGRPDEE